MPSINCATGHQPVEPDKGAQMPPKDEPKPGPPQPKHHDPEDADDAD
ncbi:MAG: hypothetical protein JWM03_166 [Rhodocyclales bacterium]|nr:hypothetical protein [Rhodocyclales bacterium]MDB5887294.1 hypothetical protein [Rhodocyclales bacterium]